ncbi:winged helix-turn-helix transcriptional regulator [Candidatus Woesearchaeota archaeon]|nr:winged helix-turn-helix transcriptional regulator [Candidatus Woesearchaeota archaeon]
MAPHWAGSVSELSYRLFFSAISNRARWRIISLLRQGPESVTALCGELGLEQSRVSHSLKCLVKCGFADCSRNGKSRIYSLNPDARAILDAVDKHLVRYESRLRECGAIQKTVRSDWYVRQLRMRGFKPAKGKVR